MSYYSVDKQETTTCFMTDSKKIADGAIVETHAVIDVGP